MNTKAIDWAYPKSLAAQKFGFVDEGCWVIRVDTPRGRKFLGAYGSPRAALKAACEVDADWDPQFLRVMSEDVKKAWGEL